MVRSVFLLLFLTMLSLPVAAGEWKAVQTTAPIAKPETPINAAKTPKGGLPDGSIAMVEPGSDISSAWYSKPTTRYGHGILGDAIEAGSLVVKTSNGKELEFILPDNQVFEDITPRLSDLGITGKMKVITILSEINLGASIAIFGIVNNKLSLMAQTPYIGLSSRWRNIAGIGDFDGDGRMQIAEVVTPHIGGTLKFWTWDQGKLLPSGEMEGFSNHFIGSREQDLSTTADFDGDGVSDLALPSANRRTLRLIKFFGKAQGKKTLQEIAAIPLPARIDKAITSVDDGSRVVISVGLEDGTVWTIQQ